MSYIYRISVFFAFIALCSGCANASNEIPMPYHEEFMAVVIENAREDGKLTNLHLLSIPEPGRQAREYHIQGSELLPFTRYNEIEPGDVLFLRFSILSDAKGNFDSAHYNILRYHSRANQSFSFSGIGNISFGQSIDDYQGQVSYPYGQDSVAACNYVALQEQPGMRFMINEKIIVRADIDDTFFATRGTPFEALWSGEVSFEDWKQANPEIEVSQHEYEEGFYLTWFDKERKSAMVAEYVQGSIKLVRAGLVPHALYIEGCS